MHLPPLFAQKVAYGGLAYTWATPGGAQWMASKTLAGFDVVICVPKDEVTRVGDVFVGFRE